MSETMVWSVVILLGAALGVESYSTHELLERLEHGRQLKITLPKNVDKLNFIPADDPSKLRLYWEKGRNSVPRGSVSGTSSDRRYYINKVTYEDQGTYIKKDVWNHEISIVKVLVIPRQNTLKYVAGESLHISLEGINMADASLFFSGKAANVTLVRNGANTIRDLPDYWDRIKINSVDIEIKSVNYSDEGHYILRDHKDRVVSVTRTELTDQHLHTTKGHPLMALLLLLGIPAGICCCCRKKIFKKKANSGAVLQTSPVTMHPPVAGPVSPCPPYSHPGQPGAVYYNDPNSSKGSMVHPPPPSSGPGQWNGPPPSPGFNNAYPPQNPCYPPAGPAAMPPAQPLQWNSPPQGQYPPGPMAPMGYAPAPVMYSPAPPPPASEPVKEQVKMENTASSPADPLLTAAPQDKAASSPVAPENLSFTNVLSSSDVGCHFQIDDGKSSTNFL